VVVIASHFYVILSEAKNLTFMILKWLVIARSVATKQYLPTPPTVIARGAQPDEAISTLIFFPHFFIFYCKAVYNMKVVKFVFEKQAQQLTRRKNV